MIHHVLPGDAVAGDFKNSKIGGEVIICREALVAGDVDAETLPEFWQQRARSILSDYGEDEIEYHEKVADQLSRLLDMDEGDEVNLWFEYELFCSVNMWFCLWLLSETGATVYRVEPSVLEPGDRWDGFAFLKPSDLKKCFAARTLFTSADIVLGASLWNAWRRRDFADLTNLADSASERFPYLQEVCEAAAEIDTRPAEILAEIGFEGITEFENIFPVFRERAGVYGFGDTQVKKVLDQM